MATATAASSFSKSLALGEIPEDMVFPFPTPDPKESEKVRGLIRGFDEYAADHIDSQEIDETGTIGDEVYRELGERGLMGLYVPEQYGGRGPSPAAYARAFPTFGGADGTPTVALPAPRTGGAK